MCQRYRTDATDSSPTMEHSRLLLLFFVAFVVLPSGVTSRPSLDSSSSSSSIRFADVAMAASNEGDALLPGTVTSTDQQQQHDDQLNDATIDKRQTGSSFRGDLGKRFRSRSGSSNDATAVTGGGRAATSGLAELLRTGAAGRTSTSLRADLGRRASSSFRPDLGKRQQYRVTADNNHDNDDDGFNAEVGGAEWLHETAPDGFSELDASATDEKRARSGFRGDLGKRSFRLWPADGLNPEVLDDDDDDVVEEEDDELASDHRLIGDALSKRRARNGFRGDLGKRRSSFRGDLGKRSNARPLVMEQLLRPADRLPSVSSQFGAADADAVDDDGLLVLFDKRRRSSLRGDLGKRRLLAGSSSKSSFRGDLGKRRPSSSFRGDLGKRRSTLRGDLGKRNSYDSVDVVSGDSPGYSLVNRRKRQAVDGVGHE